MKMLESKIQEYIRGGGIRCPYCGSDDLVGGSVEIDGGGATQPVTCNGCGCDWEDSYTLTGVNTPIASVEYDVSGGPKADTESGKAVPA